MDLEVAYLQGQLEGDVGSEFLFEGFSLKYNIFRPIDTTAKKRKIIQLAINLKNMHDCPFCGRVNLKRLLSHIMRTKACHMKIKWQIQICLQND